MSTMDALAYYVCTVLEQQMSAQTLQQWDAQGLFALYRKGAQELLDTVVPLSTADDEDKRKKHYNRPQCQYRACSNWCFKPGNSFDGKHYCSKHYRLFRSMKSSSNTSVKSTADEYNEDEVLPVFVEEVPRDWQDQAYWQLQPYRRDSRWMFHEPTKFVLDTTHTPWSLVGRDHTSLVPVDQLVNVIKSWAICCNLVVDSGLDRHSNEDSDVSDDAVDEPRGKKKARVDRRL